MHSTITDMTREEIIKEARKRYGAPVCVDFINDALEADSFEDAVEVIVTDSYYWDHAPFTGESCRAKTG